MALIRAIAYGFFDTTQLLRVFHRADTLANISIGPYGPGGVLGMRFAAGTNSGIESRLLSPANSTCIVGTRIRISAYGSGAANLGWTFCQGDGSTAGPFQCSLDVTATGQLQAVRGFAGTRTVLATSTYVLPLDTWVDVWIKVTIHNSAGTFLVNVWAPDQDAGSPTVPINLTGVDTQDTASATWDGTGFGDLTNLGTTDYAWIIVMDGSGADCNDILGPVDVYALWASQRIAPALNDWDPSSGSTGSLPAVLLDDTIADDDATYLSSSTLNEQQSTFVDAIPYPSREVLGMELFAAVRKGSGTPSIKTLARQSATVYLAPSSTSPGSSYSYAQTPYSLMPDGTTAFTVAGIDALEWGAKILSAGDPVRLTQVVVSVIQARGTGSKRNLLTGSTHEVTGDDNLIVGQENSVAGVCSEAHGVTLAVIANRSVGFALDGAPHELTENGTFKIWGRFEVEGDVTLPGFTGGTGGDVTGPGASTDNAIARFDGTAGDTLQDSTPTVEDDGRIANVTDPTNPQDVATKAYADALTGGSSGIVIDVSAIPTTWVNQGSSTIGTNTNGSIALVGAATGTGANIVAQVKTAPATPYTITAYFNPSFIQYKPFLSFGLCFRDSASGKFHLFDFVGVTTLALGSQMRSTKFTNATTFSADYINRHMLPLSWLRITDDGANRICSFGTDGEHWIQFHSIGRTDFLTANQVGFVVGTENNAVPNFNVIGNVLRWVET